MHRARDADFGGFGVRNPQQSRIKRFVLETNRLPKGGRLFLCLSMRTAEILNVPQMVHSKNKKVQQKGTTIMFS